MRKGEVILFTIQQNTIILNLWTQWVCLDLGKQLLKKCYTVRKLWKCMYDVFVNAYVVLVLSLWCYLSYNL